MSSARIYQLPKSAMQSGRAKSEGWVLEFPPCEARKPDPVRGWIGSADPQAQVRLKFETQDEAVAYATRKGISFAVELPQLRKFKPKAYADNFAFGRSDNWTH